MSKHPNPEQHLARQVQRTIASHHLITRGDVVLVAVSGGPDSIALLSVLNDLRHVLGITIVAAHVNHRLRRGAGRDERFVLEFCRSHQLPCVVKRLNIPAASKGSLEELARTRRYQALIAAARQVGATVIAIGHHRDDLAETVLMRILRGSGLLGLQGFLPGRRMLGGYFVRPLIELTRREIESYLKKKKIPFCCDPTNASTRFYRNKIRHKLLPLLKRQYQPNIIPILAQLAEHMAVDYDYLKDCGASALRKILLKASARDTVRLDITRFQKIHPSLQKMVIRLALEGLKGDLRRLTSAHWKELKDLIENRPVGSVVDLPSRIRVRKDKTALALKIIRP